jgi:hypothetical protein
MKRPSHRPHVAKDFIPLLAISVLPVTVFAGLFGYALHGGDGLTFFALVGVLIGVLATLSGWALAKRSWKKADLRKQTT